MTIQEIMQSIDNVAYSAVAVVKVPCPYAMTVSKSCDVKSWQFVVHFDDNFMILVIPQKTHASAYAPLISAIAQFTTDFKVL